MIKYLIGDATQPTPDVVESGPENGVRLITHICNNQGGWGRGFVVALSKRWPEPERAYRQWFRAGLELGHIQTVKV